MDNRDEFEKWLLKEQGLTGTWDAERNCYSEFPCHIAFKAWQAARNDAWILRKQAESVIGARRKFIGRGYAEVQSELIEFAEKLIQQAEDANNG